MVTSDNGSGRYFDAGLLGSSTWTRHQLYGQLSSPAGAANGLILVSVGNQEKTFANIVTRAAGYAFQFNSIILGTMFANIDTVPGGQHDIYVDDVYLDNTRARVELCLGATWASRGACNPQPPVAWDSTSITISLNAGAGSGRQVVYAYVMAADGAVNPVGYELTLGAIGPSAPQKLRLSP